MCPQSCRLCGSPQKLVEAHLIPRWAYPEIVRNRPGLVIPGSPSDPIGKTRKGVYDANLLCEGCERSLSEFDRYAKHFFIDTDWRSRIQFVGDHRHIRCDDFDYSKLRGFVLSVLWRCHASSRRELSKFSLGSRGDYLAKLLRREIKDAPTEFTTHIGYLTPCEEHPECDPRAVLSFPHVGRHESWKIAVMILPQFQILVFTDSRSPTDDLRVGSMQPDCPLIMDVRRLTQTEFFRFVLGAARSRGANQD
jgi:hypothetical protein